MLSGIWDMMKGAGNSIKAPLVNAYDSAMAPNDDLLADLADAEAGGAVAAQQAGSQEQKDALSAIQADDDAKKKALGQMGAAIAAAGGGGNSKPQYAPAPSVQRSGGTNIQTQDQYAMAMQALTDKYGQFMFNKSF